MNHSVHGRMIALSAVLVIAGCAMTEPEKPAWTRGDCEQFEVPAKLWNSTKSYAEGTSVTYRQLIADRLLECGSLDRMRYADVVDLLGRPDERGRRPLEAVYWVGDERSAFVVDSESLYIQFDKQRRVSEAEIGQD